MKTQMHMFAKASFVGLFLMAAPGCLLEVQVSGLDSLYADANASECQGQGGSQGGQGGSSGGKGGQGQSQGSGDQRSSQGSGQSPGQGKNQTQGGSSSQGQGCGGQRREDPLQYCHDEIERYCAKLVPARSEFESMSPEARHTRGDEIAACLRTEGNALSSACQASLMSMPAGGKASTSGST